MCVRVGGGLFWVGCGPECCVRVDQGLPGTGERLPWISGPAVVGYPPASLCWLVCISLTQLGLAGTPVQGMFSSDWPAGMSV